MIKQFIYGVVLGGLLIFCGTSYGQNVHKRYEVESGVIEYTLSGARDGVETVYFDQWGLREARYTKEVIFVGGGKYFKRTLTVWTKESIIVVDLDKNVGTKKDNQFAKEYLARPADEQLLTLGEYQMMWLKGEKQMDDVFLDRSCTVYKIDALQSTQCFWKWIPLGIKTALPKGDVFIRAVDFKENIAIPENKFRVPDKVFFLEGDNLDDIILSLRYPKSHRL